MNTVTILLIEDDADTLIALERLLQQHGYEVRCECTVEAGIAMGCAAPFDLLICDILLPDGLGTTLLIELRKHKSFPAIAISGAGYKNDLESYSAAGFDCALVKPFRFKELELAIEHCLGLPKREGV